MLYFPLSSLHIYFPDSSDDHDSDLPSQRQGYLKKKKIHLLSPYLLHF